MSQSPSNAVSGLKRRFKLAALVNLCAFAGAAAGLVLFFGMKVGAGLVLFVGSLVAGFAAQIWFMASFRRGGEGADQ